VPPGSVPRKLARLRRRLPLVIVHPHHPSTLGAPRPAPVAPVSLESIRRLLRGLDREQRRAVTHHEGPLLVVAGPGTGKTQVITRRIAWLIATKRARPDEILALTFTDKAAQEMQARVDELVPYGMADAAIHTFHALGDRLIREFALELGMASDLRLLTRAECVIFLRERLFQLGLDRYRPLADPTRFLEALVSLISRAKDEDVSVAAYGRYAEALGHEADASATAAAAPADSAAICEAAAAQRELAGAYERATALMLEAGCIDFGDQVSLALRLLRERASVRAQVQARYRYVLVDEFQDTYVAQWELVRLLAGERANLTVVGDDDQSIYTFRGAALSNILGFAARYPAARNVVLRRNYRSRAPILHAARRLIQHNDPQRLESRLGLDKQLLPRRRGKGAAAVREHVFESPGDEAEMVAAEIGDRIAAGARAGDFAILVRTNGDADPFLRSLNLRGIPWRFSGASGLYARPEVRELLAFLRVAADPTSSVDLYAVATGEPYAVGGTDLSSILEAARRRHRPLWDVLVELGSQPGILRLSETTREGVRRLVGDLRAASDLAHRRPAGEVLYDHLKRSGRLERLTAGTSTGSEAALGNVALLFAVIRDQSRVLPDDRVPFVVRHLQTLIDAGDDPASADGGDDGDAVAVLTVHKAKGLEFPVVFLVGVADGRFPGRGRREMLPLPEALCQRVDPAAGQEATFAEERRLFYVAMTRARDELILTHACHGTGGRARRPSPFLAEALDRPAATARVAVVGAGLARAGALDTFAPMETSLEPAPWQAPNGPLELSFSQLDDYLTCPRRYKLRHVLRVPTPPHHAMAYGTALHQAVAAYHGLEMRGEQMSEAGLLEVFALHWTGEGFLSRDHEEARYAAGQDALRRFRVSRMELAERPAAVERPFSFRFGVDRIRGRYDRVDDRTDGTTVITDYKSSDVRDQARADQRARESLQLAIYALAHEAEAGTLPATVQLHFLDSGVVGTASLDAKRLERTRRKVAVAAAGIRAGRFEPTPDAIGCGYCPFRDICPASAA
jgi:DNA helicase-2/ATP-dependent DNA helicase PcrA